MEAEAKEKVKAIVRNTLEKRFADDFIFDPIVVIPEVDDYLDDPFEYLHIIIVFDGDQTKLDPSWTSGFYRTHRASANSCGHKGIPRSVIRREIGVEIHGTEAEEVEKVG